MALENVRVRIQNLKDESVRLTEKLDLLNEQCNTCKQDNNRVDTEIATLRNRKLLLNMQIETSNKRLDEIDAKAANYKSHLGTSDKIKSRLEDQQGNTNDEFDDIRTKLEKLKAEEHDATSSYEKIYNRYLSTELNLEQTHKRLLVKEKEIARLEAALADAENVCTGINSNHAQSVTQDEQAEELRRLTDALQDANLRADVAERQTKSRQHQLDSVQNELDEVHKKNLIISNELKTLLDGLGGL